MSARVADGSPDPDVLERVAGELVDHAPDGWTDLLLTLWYEADDVYNIDVWVDGPGLTRARGDTGDMVYELDEMRDRQSAAGQEPWLRCDLRVTRQPGSQGPDVNADFAYEVGEIPA